MKFGFYFNSITGSPIPDSTGSKKPGWAGLLGFHI
jgi:hypothetical protein